MTTVKIGGKNIELHAARRMPELGDKPANRTSPVRRLIRSYDTEGAHNLAFRMSNSKEYVENGERK
jgi:hypothetical protein